MGLLGNLLTEFVATVRVEYAKASFAVRLTKADKCLLGSPCRSSAMGL